MKNLTNVILSYLILCLLLLTLHNTANAQTSSLVYLDNGSLTYVPFPMTGQTDSLNIIPDFSYAGYMGGGVALPQVSVVQTVSPVAGDDRQSIQDAIDYAEALTPDANGFRGAVLLTAGNYEVDGQLFIEASGVVLRGEGQGSNGTVIHANQTSQHDFLIIRGTGSGITEDTLTKQSITSTYVPVGAMSFNIANTSGFSVGDTISVKRTPNQQWIDDLGMGQSALCGSTPPPDCVGWTPESYTIKHERIITAISGNTITINIPVVDVMETQYGGGLVSKASIPGRISKCGVENLRIESYYASDTDENHAWSAVSLSRVVNSWVKRVTAKYMAYGNVIIKSESNFNTVEECAAIDHKSQITGGRRYSFTIKDGLGNLFQRCYTREGRHDFELASKVTGPNVFLDCYSANTYADIGPHHRWATGAIFDNIRGGQIRVHNRGSSGTGHGWVGGQIMFWNLTSYKSDIKVSSATGSLNWGIGCSGSTQNGSGYWEDWNNPVTPRSLYLQQLEDRLGNQAVDNIVIEEQKTGTIYSLLASWAGEGDLDSLLDPPSGTYLNSLADAYVRGGIYAGDNYGTQTGLVVKENSGSDDFDRKSFLKFDLSNITGSVASAKIRIRVKNDDVGAIHNLHLVTDDSWSETGITWSNQPSVGSLIGSASVPLIGEWIEFDVTTQVNAEMAGNDTLSVSLSESTVGYFVEYSSQDEITANYRPQLVYEPDTLPVIIAAEDAYVRGGTYAGDNFGSASGLIVKENSGTANNDRKSFLKFDLSGFSGMVSTAKIRVKVKNDDPGTAHNLHTVTNDAWSENSITWNNQPATGSLISSASVPSLDQWLEFDVTSQVNGELSGDSILSVVISESTTDHYVEYYSKDHGTSDNHPQLIYELAPPPASVSASDDAYVRGGSYAGDNYGSNSTLIVKENSSGSLQRESYLKFDLSGIPGDLLSAKIRVKVQNDDPGTTHALRFVSDDTWSESTITWNNKPSTGSSLSSGSVPLIGEWLEFDVLSQAQTELNGDSVLSVNIYETSANHYVGYHSKEATNAADRPELVYVSTSSGARRGTVTQLLSGEKLYVRQYPNPVTDQIAVFELIAPEPGILDFSIYDLSGRSIRSEKVPVSKGTQKLKISLDLTSGIYFYQFKSSQTIRTGKFWVK